MDRARLNGINVEYAIKGTGEPVLLISNGPIADSFLPFMSDMTLVDRFRLITYRQRRLATGKQSPAPISFETHAADAAALLEHLGVGCAHVAGHSTGAIIALQLASDRPDLVHTLSLLEPPLMTVPSAGAFFEKVGPALAAYGAGDLDGAMSAFLSFVSGLDWETCRKVIDKHVPGGVARAVKDADNLFGSYLPSLGAWQFGSDQAAAITQPVLSVWGTQTERLFVESHALLVSWFPQLESYPIEGIAHLLQLQSPKPVAQGITDFIARHPILDLVPGRLQQLAKVLAPDDRH